VDPVGGDMRSDTTPVDPELSFGLPFGLSIGLSINRVHKQSPSSINPRIKHRNTAAARGAV